MKTQLNFYALTKLMMLMLVCTIVMSCSSDDDGVITDDDLPELIIEVTDCPLETLVMTPKVTISGNTRRWFVNVEATITCMGEPVDKAELKVKWSWVKKAIKIKTDSTGKAKARQRVNSEPRPKGKVTVTVKGSNGSRPMTVEF